MKKISILIPDGETHTLLYVVNCLSQIKSVKIFVMSNKKRYPMRFSRHIYNFSFYPKTEVELDWINNINKELQKHNIDLVMPIFENGIETIIRYKEHILYKEKLCILPNLDNFKTAKNKGLLSEFLNNHNLPHPKGILVQSAKTENVDILKFPVIVKPVEGYGGGLGVCLFDNKTDFEDYFEQGKFNYNHIVQEFIKGYDIGCSVLCKDGKILAYTIQKSTMKGKNPYAPLLGLVFVEDKDLYVIIEDLMKLLNWSGVAHVDLKFDEQDKIFKIIEVNTRFWSSLEASLISGINFPHLYGLASLGIDFQKPNYEFFNYLNLKGLVKTLTINKKFILKIHFIWNNTPLKFAVLDPLPMIYKFFSRTKNIWSSNLRKFLIRT